jgi:hypothetical protein
MLFGYKCGMHANTKFSPFKILIGCTPKFKVENHLSMLTQEFDVEIGVEQMTEQIIAKMEMIVGMHKAILGNVEKPQQKQKKTYVLSKGRHAFPSFVIGKDMAKMKKPSKKKALEASWKGPYLFVGYANGKNEIDVDGRCMYN